MARRFRRGSFPRGAMRPRVVGSSPIVFEEAYIFDAPEPDEYFISRRTLDDAGQFFPTVVTADDAKRYIDETDTGYDRLNTAILASTAAPDFKTSWALQYGGWKTFAAGARASVGFFNSKAVMDQTDRWAQQLGDWRTEFQKIGGSAPGPAPAVPGQGIPGKGPALGDFTALIVAAGVVAAIVIFGPRLAKE